MLRAQYERCGPVPQEVIDAVEFDAPPLQAAQALLEVVAAPINPSDLLTLTGEYGDLPPLPAIGGREGVGRIAELGSDAGELAVASWSCCRAALVRGPLTSSPSRHSCSRSRTRRTHCSCR